MYNVRFFRKAWVSVREISGVKSGQGVGTLS